jgi:deoxyribonuclease-4
MSSGGGVWKSPGRGAEIGCEVIQIFVKNNRQWFGPDLRSQDQGRYASELAKSGLASVFGHAGYLINLAAPPSPTREKSIQSLIQEIRLAGDLCLPFLVMHPGAHLGAGPAAGIKQLILGLNEVLEATNASGVRIALENTAGQGTSLGSDIAQIAEVFHRVKRPDRLGICLDTAHWFEAGCDVRTPRGWDTALAAADSRIGLDQVLAFHLNDSKTGLGSRVDRHAGIGKGQIGRKAFAHMVNDPRFTVTPGCLETPKLGGIREDIKNLAVLRSLLK